MTIDAISQYAAQDIVPPEDITLPEKLLWYELRDIYRGFKSGTVTKDEGKTRKSAAISGYNRNNKDIEQTSRIIQKNAGMWMRIEEAARAYKQNKTIENADAFMEAVYGAEFKQGIDSEAEGAKKEQPTSDSAPPAQPTE